MEGRTIARPNSPTCIAQRTRRSCFNGGPDNCPAKPPRPGQGRRPSMLASMEGRTIARPNPGLQGWPMWSKCALQWRAGQLPGQTITVEASMDFLFRLQWRAGQLPGQTRRGAVDGGQPGDASMEGRTIARPNGTRHDEEAVEGYASMEGRTIARPNFIAYMAGPTCRSGFNGGPDNCPAKQRRGITRRT